MSLTSHFHADKSFYHFGDVALKSRAAGLRSIIRHQDNLKDQHFSSNEVAGKEMWSWFDAVLLVPLIRAMFFPSPPFAGSSSIRQ